MKIQRKIKGEEGNKRQREQWQKVNVLHATIPKHENKPKAVFKEGSLRSQTAG